MREVVNAIFYIAQTGCQWRLLPKNLPPYRPPVRLPGQSRKFAMSSGCGSDEVVVDAATHSTFEYAEVGAIGGRISRHHRA
jgi:transposase